MMKYFLLLFIYCVCTFALNAEPRLEISQGKLKGTVFKSRSGRKYSAFLGIPFAQPPIGNLR